MAEHITNLESSERIAHDLAQAESAHMANPDDAQAKSALSIARARAEGHKNTMELLEVEFGPVIIGLPRKTRYKSAELLAEQGYMGVYRRG